MKRDHYLQLSNHLVALLQQSSSISDELVHDSLGRLLLVDNSRHFAHEEWASVVEGFIINVIGQVLEVVLNGNDTLGSELLDLISAVLLPVKNVRVLADAEGTALSFC